MSRLGQKRILIAGRRHVLQVPNSETGCFERAESLPPNEKVAWKKKSRSLGGVSFDFARLHPKPLDLSSRQNPFELDRLICHVAMVANKDLCILTSVGDSYVQFDTKSFLLPSLKSASPSVAYPGAPSKDHAICNAKS